MLLFFAVGFAKLTCKGESTHGVQDDKWEPTNPTVYDDVATFLKDVNE